MALLDKKTSLIFFFFLECVQCTNFISEGEKHLQNQSKQIRGAVGSGGGGGGVHLASFSVQGMDTYVLKVLL